MTFILQKTMPRELTSLEHNIVKSYLKENYLDVSSEEVAEKFEKVFGTPITETCIRKIVVEMMIE
jgi:hypothetical protein